jgi:ubiquinone/menaquinone biosynthesis C-methylase UbiE
MTAFDRLAGGYDVAMLPLEAALLGRLRRSLIPRVAGRVLEIGAGTGANLPHYQPGVDLVLSEPSFAMLHRTCGKTEGMSRVCVRADAQALPFADGIFDAVVGTLVFCTIEHPSWAAREVRRVLAPQGRLYLIEHVRGEAGVVRRLTGAIGPAWHAVTRSCRIDRDTARLLESEGFTLQGAAGHLGGLFVVLEAVPA